MNRRTRACPFVSSTLYYHKWLRATDSNRLRNTLLALIVAAVCSAVGCYGPHSIPWNADPFEKQVLKSLKANYEAGWLSHGKSSHVYDLRLPGAEVTDELLDNIIKLEHLEELSLDGSTVTDDQLAKLTRLEKLRALDLQYTQITDHGMEHLLNVKSLVLIVLDNTGVTDEGLATLAKSTRWTRLHLANTKVTEAGIAKFREAVPECAVQTTTGFEYALTDGENRGK